MRAFSVYVPLARRFCVARSSVSLYAARKSPSHKDARETVGGGEPAAVGGEFGDSGGWSGGGGRGTGGGGGFEERLGGDFDGASQVLKAQLCGRLPVAEGMTGRGTAHGCDSREQQSQGGELEREVAGHLLFERRTRRGCAGATVSDVVALLPSPRKVKPVTGFKIMLLSLRVLWLVGNGCKKYLRILCI